MSGPVRVTHPFHPLFQQELDFLALRHQWGEERVFYRDRLGHLASMPARWTSATSLDPRDAATAGKSAFRASDLLELATLLAEMRR